MTDKSKMFQRRITFGHFISPFLLPILVFTLLQSPSEAVKKAYIVYMGAHAHPHGHNPSSFDLDSATSSHYSLLESYLGSNDKAKDAIFYSYTRHINGFAAMLHDTEAADIAQHPSVVSVFLNRGRKLHTTHSWDFLNMERHGMTPPDSIWNKARYGEDTIIANIDTGVWPESKSFSDDGIGPIPSKWRGICQRGVKDQVHCNRKLIGARYFNKGYFAYLKSINSSYPNSRNAEIFTARDYIGHGTMTLSIAGGNFVGGVTAFGNGNGTAKGGSPKSRLAAYKVCWPPVEDQECFDADILAAFDAAISDGVDVLSVSIGNDKPVEFVEEAISIGAFHAAKHGISVVTAAGNSGPLPGTVWDGSPWTFTVGASTIDREFISYIALGNRKHVKGASLSSKALPSQKFYPLISGANARSAKASASDALLCKPESLDPKKVKGKILVCIWRESTGLRKSHWASLAGAIGIILANDFANGNDVTADPYLLPAANINFTDGEIVFNYLNSSKNPMAYLTRSKTKFGVKPAPMMASFSSRGPNMIEPGILKPDVTAPGVSIIAAYSKARAPSRETFDKRRVPFNVESGTSLSCPHVSGIAGLLKTLHPDWSPAAIKSAIMTTARTRDNNKEPMLDEVTMRKATPFVYGAGHIRPNRAMDPGLVYDLTVNDYLDFLCARGYNKTAFRLFSTKPYKCPESFELANFNYPAIVVTKLGSNPLTVTRTVKNVGTPGTYTAKMRSPMGVSITVKPKILVFSRIGEEKKFEIVLTAKIGKKRPKDYVFGQLKWSDGTHFVRSPIAVKRR